MTEPNIEIALFIDFENLALGFKGRGRKAEFDIERVLARLVEKGKVVMKRAYCDWTRFSAYKTALHEAAIELVEIPRRSMTGKNSADIRLVVDAMDMCYSKEHIKTFVIASGDSDFSPLVSKLKENGKHVIGLGMKNATSELLVDNCDEFIFYEDLGTEESARPRAGGEVPPQQREAFELLFESIDALMRENVDLLWSSLVKDTMKRKKPSFTERAHGYRSFSDLLEAAQGYGYIQLRRDERSGSYIISGFHPDPAGTEKPPAKKASPAAKSKRGSSSGRRRGPRKKTAAAVSREAGE